MALEAFTAVNVLKPENNVENMMKALEREILELPEEIGELSIWELLPDEMDDEILYSIGNDLDLMKQYEPRDKMIVNDRTYETDNDGYIYKVDGYRLLSNCEYNIDGVIYITDERGRIIIWRGVPKYTPEGERDNQAQILAGGEDRREGDQGGHLLARVLGGAKGIENMLAMRGPINQGPYSLMEKEIINALKEGKEAYICGRIGYTGDSQRPSMIDVTYTIDGKETLMEYDNEAGSTELLASLENKIGMEEYNDLKQEIQDARADGANISILAVKTERDTAGNIEKVTVWTRDENSENPKNEVRVFLPKEDK